MPTMRDTAIVLPAPKGVDMRPDAGLDTALFMVNLDVADGAVVPRPTFRRFSSSASIATPHMLAAKDGNGNEFLVTAGVADPRSYSPSYHRPRLQVLDTSGALVFDEYIPWEAPDREWSCSMLEAIQLDANNVGEPVVLIFADVVHVYRLNAHTLERADLTSAIRLADQSGSYWDRGRAGPVATYHNTRIWFALKSRTTVELSGQIPDDNARIPDHWVRSDRNRVDFPEGTAVFTDPDDPLGIWAYNFLRPEGNEKVVSIQSLNESLYLFTDKGIHSVSGDILLDGGLSSRRVYGGVGTVSHHATVCTPAGVFFVGRGGIYQFDGESVAKISAPLGPLWSGFSPPGYDPGTAEWPHHLGLPWKIDESLVHTARAAHFPDLTQVWFTIPLVGRYRWVTVVYDYKAGTWWIYARRDLLPLAMGAVRFNGETIVSGPQATVMRRGTGDAASTTSSEYAIKTVYVSHALSSGNGHVTFRNARLHVKATSNVVDYESAYYHHGAIVTLTADGFQSDADETPRNYSADTVPLCPFPDKAVSITGLAGGASPYFTIGSSVIQKGGWFWAIFHPSAVTGREAHLSIHSFPSDGGAQVLHWRGAIVDVLESGGQR